MRILIVGSGGREHALAWKLAQEAEVHASPGNPGIAECAQCHLASPSIADLTALAKNLSPDLVVVGPEAPLIAGLADSLRTHEIPTFGVDAAGAQLEGSKAFSKELMRAAGVPTARYLTVSDADEAREFARQSYLEGRQLAVKVSGPALGKGVAVCDSLEMALEEIDRALVRGEFGEAGRKLVLEERLFGREFSLMCLCSGERFVSLPLAQDYKRAWEGDAGPNTGGMGSYSPVEWVDDGLVHETERRVIAPLLSELRNRGIDYRGALFAGLMVVEGEPFCLEYNVRFGDPETQSVMPRLGDGFADSLLGVALGRPPQPIAVRDLACVTVIVASRGYPGTIEKGLPIEVGPVADDALLFHAGTAVSEGRWVTAGGRVMGATGLGPDLPAARSAAYRAAEQVRFEGAWFRPDIGN